MCGLQTFSFHSTGSFGLFWLLLLLFLKICSLMNSASLFLICFCLSFVCNVHNKESWHTNICLSASWLQTQCEQLSHDSITLVMATSSSFPPPWQTVPSESEPKWILSFLICFISCIMTQEMNLIQHFYFPKSLQNFLAIISWSKF